MWAWAVCALLLLALAASCRPVLRWKYRHIPGPVGWPLIGNLVPLVLVGTHHYLEACRKKYGQVFKIWFGGTPWVTVADPEAARRVLFKFNNRVVLNNSVFRDEDGRRLVYSGLAAAKGSLWRDLRMAWQPAFQSDSLAAYTALMNRCASKLIERLDAVASTGDNVVDVWRELGNMTMAVVGTTAFGVDFHTMDSETEASSKGKQLVAAVTTLFAAGNLLNTSIWAILGILMPGAEQVLHWFGNRLPDRNLIIVRAAQDKLRDVSRSINRQQRSAAEAIVTDVYDRPQPSQLTKRTSQQDGDGKAAGGGDLSPAGEWQAPHVSDGAQGPVGTSLDEAKGIEASKSGQSGRPKGIEPGNFVGLIASAKKRETGQKLDEVELLAQSNTFIAAGYETTANTLGAAVHCLSHAPDAEAEVLKEVDAFGRDKEPTYEDLIKFPYIEAVVKESLRLYAPVPVINRLSDQPLQLCGYQLPAGTCLTLPIFSLHHDPQLWHDPWQFRPERFLPGGEAAGAYPAAHIPFGGGARMCIGYKFAMQEAKLALVRMYQRFVFRPEDLAAPKGVNAPLLPLRVGVTLSPRDGVRVRVLRRE